MHVRQSTIFPSIVHEWLHPWQWSWARQKMRKNVLEQKWPLESEFKLKIRSFVLMSRWKKWKNNTQKLNGREIVHSKDWKDKAKTGRYRKTFARDLFVLYFALLEFLFSLNFQLIFGSTNLILFWARAVPRACKTVNCLHFLVFRFRFQFRWHPKTHQLMMRRSEF